MENKIMVNQKEYLYETGMTLFSLAKANNDKFLGDVVLAIKNGKLTELNKKVAPGDTVELLDTTSHDGYRTYQRSLSFLLIKSVYDLLPDQEIQVIVDYAINSGYYIEIKGKVNIDSAFIKSLKEKMLELSKANMPFKKEIVHLDRAREIFEKQKMNDKLELFKYRKASNVNLYELDGLYDYFYGYMVPSTGYLSCFDLYPYDEGLILQFAKRTKPNVVDTFNPDKKLFGTLKEATNWAAIMDVYDVGTLNNMVASGKANEMILVAEALMEKRMGALADEIALNVQTKKFVFIAGPSSSGKTTFAHRLGIQMKAHGIKPHIISVDNYFVNREDTPLDAEGNYDFECLEAINIDAFNRDMTNLLSGKSVDMPTFNFVKGKPDYDGKLLTIGENDIMIIEGIHGLNDQLSYSIPAENKFKIYISALTQLNVDQHNRIPTTDTRLIRRIVRDNQYRGASAEKTISMWPSVRRGEDHHIFPFQEASDAMFNSALIYELAVLKQFAEPLLFNVPRDSRAYIEAKRLIKFLDYFMTIPSEQIPINSLLREFIGGSCFRE